MATVRDFGAVGDGNSHPLSASYPSLGAAQSDFPHAVALTDEIDWAAIQAAVNAPNAASSSGNRKAVELGGGDFVVNRTVSITGAHKEVGFVGCQWAPEQGGSFATECRVKWTGGSTPVFSVGNTFTPFVGISINNYGTGTNAINFTGQAGRAYFFRMSFVSPTKWSQASIGFQSSVDYSYAYRCEFGASTAIYHRGDGTDFHILDSNFDGGAGGSGGSWIDFQGNINRFIIERCTINYVTPNNLSFWDSSANDGEVLILRMVGNEFAGAESDGQFIAKAKNVKFFKFEDNNLNSFGNVTAEPIQLWNSVLLPSGTAGGSCAMPLAKTNDSTSWVLPGRNALLPTNTRGIVGDGSQNAMHVPIEAGANVDIHGETTAANSDPVYAVTYSENIASTIRILRPSDQPSGRMEPGQKFWIVIRNTSTSPLTGISWSGQFKMSGGVSSPAPGRSRGFLFRWDGASAIELTRSAADVQN